MLFFVIELDEEKILKDRIINLDAAYKCIEDTFAQRDVTLYKQEGAVRYYTRNIDKHDFEYLWMVNLLFKKEDWFGDYIKQWRFLDIDDETNEIYEDEDLLEESDMIQRKRFRAEVKKIINSMAGDYEDIIKWYFWDSSYQRIEEDEFILFYKKDFSDYKTGVRLISINLDKCEKAGIAALIYLMKNNELPDSVIIAFLKDTNDKKKRIQKLVKLLKKTKRTFRAIVLDITNTGWDEGCDFTFENCYLTPRMYKNLLWCLHCRNEGWKIIPEDRQMLKGILFGEEHFTTNDSRKNECDYYRDCGINCFSFCLPVIEDVEIGKDVTIDIDRLGWYMYVLIQLAEKKI